MKLQFTGKAFDCAVFLNGDIPDRATISKAGNIPLYAADGAANKLIDMGIIPDVVAGDLDSFSLTDDFSFEIIHIPDQEKNDFEKILDLIASRELEKVLVFGFHGGELEHTLNNWSILKKLSRRLNLCIYDHGRYAVPIKSDIEVEAEPEEMISLIPQPEVELKTKGLQWELNNEILAMGIREGARNVTSSGKFEIKIQRGSLLLFLDERLPFCPEFI